MSAAALVAFVLVLGAAAPAFAATAPYAQWKVGLWPEYDDQRTLVIYEPRLAESTTLPFQFSYAGFPLDAQVGMTCQVTPTGSHECQQRQTNVVGDKETISYTVPSQRQLYMEYYTDMMSGKKPKQRKMTYTFTAPADIQQLEVSIKQPKDATAFNVTPKSATQQTDSDGFTIDTFSLNDVKAGQKYAFSFSYSRPSWTPPVAKTQNSSGGQTQAGGPRATGTNQASAGLGNQVLALVAVIAFIGAFMMLVLRRQPSAAAAPAKSSRSSSTTKKRSGPANRAKSGASKAQAKN